VGFVGPRLGPWPGSQLCLCLVIIVHWPTLGPCVVSDCSFSEDYLLGMNRWNMSVHIPNVIYFKSLCVFISTFVNIYKP
jgi:hypothetical protein